MAKQTKIEPKKEQIKKEVKTEVKKFTIPQNILDLLFVKHKLDKNESLGKTKEEILKEYRTEFDKLVKITIEEARHRATFSRIYRLYAGELKTRSERAIVAFIPECSDKEGKDVNLKKRLKDATIPEKYIRNVGGLQYFEKEGALSPFIGTCWDELATMDIPMSTWLKIQFVPRGNADSQEYRMGTLRKIIGEEKVLVDGEEFDVPSLEEIIEEQYFPVISTNDVAKYADIKEFDDESQKLVNVQVGKFVIIKGGVINLNTSPSKSGNYTYQIMSDSDEGTIEESIAITAITPDEPTLDIGSDILAFGRPFKGKSFDRPAEDDVGEPIPEEANYTMMATYIKGGENIISIDDSTSLGTTGEYEEFIEEKIDEPKEEVSTEDLEPEPEEEVKKPKKETKKGKTKPKDEPKKEEKETDPFEEEAAVGDEPLEEDEFL